MINYYEVLNVSPNANLDEIKRAYLAQIKKYHPDLYQGDSSIAQEKTAILNEGYNILKDENLRREYNQRLFKNKTSKTSTNKTNSSSKIHTTKKEDISVFKEFAKLLNINLKNRKNKNKKNKEKIVEINPKFVIDKDIQHFSKKEISEKNKLTIMILLILLGIIIIILICLFL